MAVAVKKRCPDCGEEFWNRGAHYEACRGSLSEGDTYEAARAVPGPCEAASGGEAPPASVAPSEREWTGWFQVSGLCGCPPRRDGGRCPHMNPYVPTFRVAQATEGER